MRRTILALLLMVGIPLAALDIDLAAELGRSPKPWAGATAAAQAWMRHLRAGWEAIGPKDPRWDADMPGILAAAAERAVWPGALPPPRHTDALRTLQRHLKDPRLGADPTARFAAMVLEPERRQQFPHVNVILKIRGASMAALPASGMMGAMANAICYESWNGDKKAASVQPPIVADLAWYLSLSLARGEFDQAPHVVLTHLDYLGMSQADHVAVVEDALRTRAASAAAMADPWMRAMLEGRIAMLKAWAARGHGWARDVTEEGWRGFAEHQAQASARFQAAWRLRSDDPAPAIALMELARSGIDTGAEAQTWRRRALRAGFDHPGIHASLRTYTAPRWGGTHEDQAALARAYAASGRFDTLLPWQFLLMVRQIDNDGHPQGRGSAALRDPAMVAAVHACIDGYLARVAADDEILRGWYECQRIAVLVRLGRANEARTRYAALPKARRRDEVLRDWGLSAKDLAEPGPAPAPVAPPPSPGF
ncbi:MAG: hypothetical protein RLZZ127_519 [Planctomycetota bacterium]|jgi:hypothetical protein